MTAVPQSFLHVVEPAVGESIVRLVPGNRVTLGRAPSNDVILHDERASRVHAEIVSGPDGWLVRDLQSRNGTTVNGTAVVSERPLAAGDVIGIGLVQIAFTDGAPPTGARRSYCAVDVWQVLAAGVTCHNSEPAACVASQRAS